MTDAMQKVVVLNMLAKQAGCSNSDEALAWMIARGYVSSTGAPFDDPTAFRITKAGEDLIREEMP